MVVVKYTYIFFVVFFIVSIFNGCGDENRKSQRITLLGADTTRINPNGLAYISADKVAERKNKIELSKIEADAKVKIAKIQTQGQLSIAQVNAKTQQEIAKSNSIAKITASKVDANTKKETMQYTVYIVIAIVLLLMIAVFLLYQNSKKNRELKKELEEEKLRHEKALLEKELEEKRLHKILDLVAAGKMPATIEEEVILAISKPKDKFINN